MLMYALIGLSLVLVGIVGLQFSYLFYADRLDRARRQHLSALQHRCTGLEDQLSASEQRVAEQDAFIASIYPEGAAREEEAWADVIEER